MSISMHITNEAFRLKLQYASETPEKPNKLVSGRRDTAAFQVIINSDIQYSLTATPSEWYSQSTNHITPTEHRRLRVAVEAPFPVETNLEDFLTDDDCTQKADILLTQDVRESPANVPSALWVELKVPADVRPGEYTVKVLLFSSMYDEDEVLVAEDSIPLDVYSYVMPESKDFKFYLDLWQHNSNVARKHDVKLWSEEHFAVLESYAASLATLGQKSIFICASESPWGGWKSAANQRYNGNLYEYSMIGITKELDGSFTYDYSKMQRYIDICTSKGISGDIEVFGIVNIWDNEYMSSKALCEEYGERIRLRYLDKSDGCMKYMRSLEEIKHYIKSLETYFIETQQINRVRIAADEPSDIVKYRKSISLIRELTPAFLFKTAINHAEFIGEFGENINDFAPSLHCACDEYSKLMEYKGDNPQKKFLFYVCCGPVHPNTFLCSPLAESRLLPIITNYLRFDGFLRWNYTVWPDNPRKEMRYGHWRTGDTNFVYPGYNGQVMLSLRYKNFQRGVYDYEVLEEIRRNKGDDTADALIAKVFFPGDLADFYANMHNNPEKFFSRDWNRYNDLKAEMLNVFEP